MSLSLSPTVALAEESDVTEPLAEETAADGPALSDEARPPEDAATEEVADEGDEENVLDAPALFKDTQPLEALAGEGDPASGDPAEAPGLPGGQDAPAGTEDDTTPPQETDGPAAVPALTGDPAGEPALISAEVKPTSAQQTYLAAHAGTYVTEKKEYVNSGTRYESSEWTIVITGDGSGIQLLRDGEDTGAVVTKLDGTSSITAITFSNEGEWFTKEKEAVVAAELKFSFSSAGYITMPKMDVYNEAQEVLYHFSSDVIMYNQTKAQAYFKDHPEFQGTYTLSDGSGWTITIGEDGQPKLTGGEGIFLDHVEFGTSATSSGNTYHDVKKLVFSSANWYNSTAKTAYQKLTLTWTASSNNKAYNYFKCSNGTFYDATKKPIKGFNVNSYFIADDGMFSFTYFSGDEGKYVGKYVLSDAYGTVYGGDIDGIGDWYIEVAENGHVYLHAGEEKREAVATGTSSDRVSTMYVCVPDRYTDAACAIPVSIKLTWDYDSTAKAVKLSFTAEALATAYKPVGGKGVKTFIPPMRFELLGEGADSKNTEFAKSKLKDYAEKYIVNDESGEYIEIAADGSVKLCIPKKGEAGFDEYTPLYYNLNDAKWVNGGDSDVASVVFSAPNWFDANKKAAENDRKTVEMTWDPANEQFAVKTAVTCYEPDSDKVSRAYSAVTAYFLEQFIDEAEKYMTQYVTGEYTLNDGSGWKLKVDEAGKVYTKFDTESDAAEYEEVANPAPVFAYDKSHTAAQNTDTALKEWGNDGKYLSTITVPVPGWYADEACTQEAIVKLTWNGKLTNPIDDHQFNVGDGDKTAGYALYRKTDGETECKYLAGTFYSDTDRKKGEDFLQSIGAAGTYHPTAAEGKWWIEIADDGKVTVYATDSQNEEHTITDVAMDLTMNKSIKNHNNPDFGQIEAVTDIKVVFPEWRGTKTNDTLANIAQCGETTFTFTQNQTYVASSYFTPSNTYIYDNTDASGKPWEVKTKTSDPSYNKTLNTKLYKEDRAYTDANKDAAKAYFKAHAGHYYIDEAELDYMITVTEEGQIYWGDLSSGTKPLPADVAFDAIRDDDGDGKVSEGESTPVPGTISVWLNGYTTAKVSSSTGTKETYNEGTPRAEFTWNDTDEEDVAHSAHTFKSKSAKGFKVGATSQTNFAEGKYYNIGDAVTAEDFVEDGTYETTDAKFRIEIKTDETTGNTTYTFYRPEPDPKLDGYPLKLFGSGDAAYLRGFIGKMKKNDVYLVVTKGPYEGFLLTGYEVTYNDLDGKQQTSSSAPTVTLPARTRFTNYALGDTGTVKNIIVAEPGQDVDTGTAYSRLSLALHGLNGGETIYLTDDIKVGFEAKLPDGVGDVTIDGQGHTITRDVFVNPNTILMDPEISLVALEEEGAELPEEHYDGAILQVGAGDTVTLKNVTIDGEGKWEIDEAKLAHDKELNKDYDVDVLDQPGDPLAGHPIKELPGNLVSTDSLIKVAGGTLILDKVTLENFFAGDGYDDDRHFIDFTSTEGGKLEVRSETVFKHNASRSGVCIGNTDKDEILLNGCTTMEDNYCYGGNGGLLVAMEGTQVYMDEGTKILNDVAADTNGVFIQLHKKTDGVKDGDNKGDIYAKLHMKGGEIGNNVGLRGGSYGWGQTIYLYNGGAFEMDGGEIHDNIGAGISSIYQQPSADALKLNGGKIYGNTCSLTDEGTDWPLDIALMNIGNIGEDMAVEQSIVVGAAAILGGYASGDEYLTIDGTVKGNISVYSYFNNEGNVSTVVNNHIIDGNIRLENGSMVKNNESGVITGNVKVRGSLTESAGESSFHNEGDIKGDVELAEGAHLYNSGEVYGNVTVKSGGTLELNCNEEGHSHGGVIHGDVILYPDGLIYADVKPTQIDGTIYLEYETEADRVRMLDVLNTCGIEYADVVEILHDHTEDYDVDVTVVDPGDQNRCTDSTTTVYTCKACGKVVKTEVTPPRGYHEYFVSSTQEATCTTGAIEHLRCEDCSAYSTAGSEVKVQVSAPNGHHYVENRDLRIPATEYGSGHEYYICTECGDLLEIEVPPFDHGKTQHSFQTGDGELDVTKGVEKTEATCTTPGEVDFICDGCGATITITIPAKGHSYSRDPKDYIVIGSDDSTCSTAGYIKYAPVCTVCHKDAAENGDNSTSSNKNNLTFQVTLPKLEHEWSGWEDVEEGDYLCTEEREQERSCALCGAIEERIGGESGHTWDAKHVTCTVCGYTTSGHHIDYMLNGGAAPAGLASITDRVYTPGGEVPLWQPDPGVPWTKNTADGQAVFIGWSRMDPGAAPAETPPEGEFVTAVVIPEDADAVVFAAWAVDKNRNGIPDYNETAVSIIYNANGGDGTVPASLTGVLPGGAYPLETSPSLKKGDDLFAGWSMTKQETVITTSAESKAIIDSLVTSPFPVPAETVGDITLYAVYATDADADGKPDYCEDALHVEYYINGGQVHAGHTVNDEGMFYVCNDYHHPGDDATLLALEYGMMMIYREGAVLIGWSAAPCEELVTSKEKIAEDEDEFKYLMGTGEKAELITTVGLTGAESNAKVYAVWAADENNNHVADYDEAVLMHTYHRNQFLSESGGRTIEPGWKLDVQKEEPERQNNILPGMGVELSPNDYFGSADLLDSENHKQGHYIQMGWSGYSHGACKSKTDYNNWVIAGDANGYIDEESGKYYRVIYDSRFQNAFAIWATDSDENGIADYLETYYTISLELNGGTPAEDGFPHTTVLEVEEQFTFPPTPSRRVMPSGAGPPTAARPFTRRETKSRQLPT